MNKYLEKIAKEKEKFSKGQKATAGAAVAIGGATVAHGQYHAGNVTGRETLFHGTTEANKADILKEGLKPRAKKGIIDLAEAHNGKSLKSDDLSFMTRKRSQAHFYSNQAHDIHTGAFDMNNEVKRTLNMIPTRNSMKGQVHINAPTWKKDEFHKVRNPELKQAFQKINNPYNFNFHQTKKQQKTQTYQALEKDVFTNKGTVHNKYMRGSDAYVKNSVGEIKDFAKANTKRFLKGVGKAGAGVAAVGAGLYYAGKQFKHDK